MINKNIFSSISLRTRANWESNCIESFKDLVDSEKDGFCKFFHKGKLTWKSELIQCLNRERLKLPKWFGQEIIYPDLSIILLNSAFAYKQKSIRGKYRNFLRGEVWSSDFHIVKESLLHRNAHILLSKSAVSKMRMQAEFKKGVYIYLGWIAQHYGHFLLQGLSWVWPFVVTDFVRDNITPVAHSRKDVKTIKELDNYFVSEAYKRLGIKLSEIYEIRNPTIFEKLLIPVPSFRLGRNSYSTPVQSKVWAEIRGEINPKTDKKIYLSRRKYSRGGMLKRPILNELEIEQLFLKNNYEIIYPETIPIEEQLKLYGSCSVIAGSSGSNMHNSAFIPDNSKVLIIAPTSFCVKNDYMINVHKSIETNYFFVEAKDVTCRSQHYWTVNIEQLENCLLKKNF